jgi:hypothetical protein
MPSRNNSKAECESWAAERNGFIAVGAILFLRNLKWLFYQLFNTKANVNAFLYNSYPLINTCAGTVFA